MEWSRKLGALRRGVGILVRLVRAELAPKRPAAPTPPPQPGLTVEVTRFGDNPGRLRMLVHGRANAPGAPLLVLLHGCGQDAAAFAADAGWFDLADAAGFPVVLPVQIESNNRGRCFQWFLPRQTARGQGEAASIAAMVRTAAAEYASDPGRVFVVGLSAGGAMAAALLAAYPDLFAAGASVAGLPVGIADSAASGLLRMINPGRPRTAAEWADNVRRAGPPGFDRPWPRLSVWHGGADRTVVPENGEYLVSQWRGLHGLDDAPVLDVRRDGVRHRAWGPADRPLVELWTLADLTHGYPVAGHVARSSPYMLPAGTAATPMIARFFGLRPRGE